ncbi:HAD-IC family P-type ATPase [Candidatus Pacebacteria bacterium]|nr:HAD-IC family P-type ATPase [Candidatus Paceibacterota bacterium]
MSSSSKSRTSDHHFSKPSYTNWHAISPEETLAAFDATTEGLAKADVAERTAAFGPNQFSETKTDSFFIQVINQLKSPLAFVLLVAFAITAALQEFVDAGVILFALCIALVVGVIQEGKASRAFKKLSESQVTHATVIREGQRQQVSAPQLVPGDIVVIQNGMQVPADMRIIQSKNLTINEASLTGEWLAVEKQSTKASVGAALAEQSSMGWMGTFVASGQGLGVVTATGDQTAMGALAHDVQDVVEVSTPLQVEMRKVSKIMIYIIGVLVAGIFIIGIWQGLSLHDMLLLSIAIAVASVPEGLPAAVTIILAVGMEALLKRGGLVRNLLAAETLGSTTYVLTDKTGTLTQARMAVTSIILPASTETEPESWPENPRIRNLFNISLAATDAYIDGETGKVRGDSVERAIVSACKESAIELSHDSLRSERFDYMPFESENRFAAGLSGAKEAPLLCINGSPEILLENAAKVCLDGESVDMTDEVRLRFTREIEAMTTAGKRLVAVGFQKPSYTDIPEHTQTALLRDLTYVGVIVLDDPVREGVDEAIDGVQSAGAKVLLITGDNPQTALSIALQAGVVEAGARALTGTDLAEMTDEEILAEIEAGVHVFARVLPRQKMRIATILQQKGEIVAMTGDGINDAPALRRANIGIAIGSGTEVAKESSDLVLVKDSFATIYAAIEEGRRIISNLRKIVGYLLSTSLSEVVLVGAAIIVGAPTPILPAQILWANVIEEGLMSVAFAFEKGEKGAMRRKPQDIHEEGILSRDMLWFMAMVITILSALSLALYFYLRSLNLPLEELRSAMFLSISIDSLFMAFAFRSLTTPVWKIPLHTNLFFIGSFLISAALLGIVLTVPFFQKVLSYTPLPMFDILLVLGFSLAALVTIEICKWIFFERRR